MADQVNYYEVLGVSRNASQSEIKNAYRKLAKERHPDHPGGSQREFSLLQEAHDVLSDPERRRQHDQALDLAYAADQLSGLDFSQLEDELAARRQQHESSGPGLGERLRDKFRRKEEPQQSGRRGDRVRGRYLVREARWYEPHRFDPEPVTWTSGVISFVAAFIAFIVIGQIGRWATHMDVPPNFAASWAPALQPVMPVLYALVGFVASYFTFRYAGYVAVALVFVSALVVGGRGGPEGLMQFGTLGILIFLLWIYLGNRREQSRR